MGRWRWSSRGWCGDVAGMFDGPTSDRIALTSHLVVIDLSALDTSPALGLLMICATWLQAALQHDDAVVKARLSLGLWDSARARELEKELAESMSA